MANIECYRTAAALYYAGCERAIALLFMDRPTGFQEVKVPRFHDNGTGWW